jgi:hypothetical protein
MNPADPWLRGSGKILTYKEEEEAQTEFERESERRQDANEKKNEEEESA